MPIKSTSKSAAKKKSAVPFKKSAPAKPVAAKPVPAKAAPAPVKKKAPSRGPGRKTSISAKIDVGWGNSVYLRGIGGGLSWDVGVLMDNAKKDEWTWACPSSDGPITYKFVRNDVHWALGPDRIAAPGETAVVTPQFPPW